jgi:hypothetical protein
MNAVKSDALLTSVKQLRDTLASESRDDPWADAVHFALGRVAAAIQAEVQTSERARANVGEINPDFRDSPNAARHVNDMREHWIQLGEQVHQLRAGLRSARDEQRLDAHLLRADCEALAQAIEKVRRTESEFLLNTLNSNPGAGE